MQVVISSNSELSTFGWIVVVTAMLFLLFLLIMFVSAVALYITQTFEENSTFEEEEMCINHRGHESE